MKLIILKRPDIAAERWDNTIKSSKNGRIYAYSWYLDIVSPNWSAIVSEDYEYIFPLPIGKNILTHKRILQPMLCQQLGLFTSNTEITQEILSSFLSKIPDEYSFVDLQLNEGNIELEQLGNWNFYKRPNMLLDLSPKYEVLHQKFSKSTANNIKKAKATALKIEYVTKLDFLEGLKAVYAKKKLLKSIDLNLIGQLIDACLSHKNGFMRGVYNQWGKLLAADFYGKDQNRIYKLLSFSTEEGRNNEAGYKILDSVIWENAEKNLLLDFEGSSIPGVAKFNAGFGTVSVPYYRIIRDNLPIWMVKIMKWIKKH